MSRVLPPLDLHAHVDPHISPRSLEALGAVVFAAGRSLEEFEHVSGRTDAVTVWGLGCHPGVMAAEDGFSQARFVKLLVGSPYVSEVGLDGNSEVALELQSEVFRSILAEVGKRPRLLSVHSRRASTLALDLIESSGVERPILHWWLGAESETRRALGLGCMFSVNRSMDILKLRAAGVPLDRLLPETDHPSGNRRGGGIRQPGWTVDVEQAVGEIYGLSQEAVRLRFWNTFVRLVDDLKVAGLLPPVVQAMVSQARKSVR